jgi:hypothetical protein
MSLLRSLLSSRSYITLSKPLARRIGNNAAIMYAEIIAKNEYFKEKGKLTADGFFYNTIENMEEDTCLTERQQKPAIKLLMSLGLIEYKVKGQPAKRHFKIVDDERILISVLDGTHQQFRQNVKTSFAEMSELDSTKSRANNNNIKKINNKNNRKEGDLSPGNFINHSSNEIPKEKEIVEKISLKDGEAIASHSKDSLKEKSNSENAKHSPSLKKESNDLFQTICDVTNSMSTKHQNYNLKRYKNIISEQMLLGLKQLLIDKPNQQSQSLAKVIITYVREYKKNPSNMELKKMVEILGGKIKPSDFNNFMKEHPFENVSVKSITDFIEKGTEKYRASNTQTFFVDKPKERKTVRKTTDFRALIKGGY